MACIEIDRCATGHEMSNQQWWLPTTSQLHLFCTTWSLIRTILNPASWWLAKKLMLYRSLVSNGPKNKHSPEEQIWHYASTTSTVAPLRVARHYDGSLPKTSKTTTAWWLVSKSTNMPAAIKSRSSPTQTWIALGKLVATYKNAAFLHYMISTQDRFKLC